MWTLLQGWSHRYKNDTVDITTWLTVPKYQYLKWQWIFYTSYLYFSFLYHCQDFYQTWLYISVTQWVSYKKQELLTLRENLSSLPVFVEVRVAAHLFFHCFFLLSFYVFLRSDFRVVMSVTISAYKLCSVRLYLQLFVGGLMSLPPVVCRRAHVLFPLFVIVCS